MPTPAVKGYMPLCVTSRSSVCDEQGIGQWPMWKRYDSVKSIIDQYIDEPYRDFLALPYYDVDKQKSEEYFYWYTPRSNANFVRLSHNKVEYDYYKTLLDNTLSHYNAVIDRLKSEGKAEEANFLQMSLKYAGDYEGNVYCGDGRVVVTSWGMRPRDGYNLGEPILYAELSPENQIHTVYFDLGGQGVSQNTTLLKKTHGAKIFAQQVPQVKAMDGYEFMGWDRDPEGVSVTSDLHFVAQYRELSQEGHSDEHHVRFLTPDGQVVKELYVKHGTWIPSDQIPQLPAVDGVVSQGWDGDPLNDIVNADRDYQAIAPNHPDKPMHTVRFLLPDGNVIVQYPVEHGTQLTSAQVPPLPVVDGVVCSGWNTDPLAVKIDSDRDFVAMLPVAKGPAKTGKNGLWRALLNWLLLALGLLLLFLLLWLFLLGKGHFDFCGCNCVEPIDRPVVTVKDKPLHPCDMMQTAGSNTAEGFVFNMGQKSGSFLFEYNTGGIYPDLIVIYEGANNKGKEIFRYYGTTGSYSNRVDTVYFKKSKIYIEVTPDSDENTRWEIIVNCPNN